MKMFRFAAAAMDLACVSWTFIVMAAFQMSLGLQDMFCTTAASEPPHAPTWQRSAACLEELGHTAYKTLLSCVRPLKVKIHGNKSVVEAEMGEQNGYAGPVRGDVLGARK